MNKIVTKISTSDQRLTTKCQNINRLELQIAGSEFKQYKEWIIFNLGHFQLSKISKYQNLHRKVMDLSALYWTESVVGQENYSSRQSSTSHFIELIQNRRAQKSIIQTSPGALAVSTRFTSLEKPGVFRRAKSEDVNNFSI